MRHCLGSRHRKWTYMGSVLDKRKRHELLRSQTRAKRQCNAQRQRHGQTCNTSEALWVSSMNIVPSSRLVPMITGTSWISPWCASSGPEAENSTLSTTGAQLIVDLMGVQMRYRWGQIRVELGSKRGGECVGSDDHSIVDRLG